MIKGSIEDVSPQAVSGWIYSSATPLRDTTVLAFSGGDCIGTGKVGRFRQDLADAGLDDGHLGFSFPINLPDGADVASVVVRLDGSEAVLLQPRSRVTGPETASRDQEPSVEETLRRIRWLRRRNCLGGSEYNFLRGLTRFGVYEFSLETDTDAPGQQSAEEGAAAQAKKLLELTELNEVTLRLDRAAGADAMLQALRSVTDQEGSLNHVVIWSALPTRIGVVEGGHLSGSADMDVAGAVDYHLDPSIALVVHTRCAVVPRPGANYQAVLVMSATAGEDVPEPAPTRRPEPAMAQR
jgi:hypothetical protein